MRELIRMLLRGNAGWGGLRIHGEPQLLGIRVSLARVAKYMVQRSTRFSVSLNSPSIHSEPLGNKRTTPVKQVPMANLFVKQHLTVLQA